MTTPKKPKVKSGGARDIEAGKSTVLLLVTEDEKAMIRQAAELDNRSVRNYSLLAVLAQAKKDVAEKLGK